MEFLQHIKHSHVKFASIARKLQFLNIQLCAQAEECKDYDLDGQIHFHLFAKYLVNLYFSTQLHTWNLK